MRDCCESYDGFAHIKYCKWARKHCPPWIDPFITDAPDSGTRQKLYIEALKDTVLMVTFPNGVRKAGKVTYCWIGRDGWPVTFRLNDEYDYTLGDYDVVNLTATKPCIYPRLPTAEEVYEMLRNNEPSRP